MRKHTKNYNYFKTSSPYWMTQEAVLTLMRGYLLPDETPIELYRRLAKKSSSYYSNGVGNLTQEEYYDQLLDIFLNGWLSPSSPVASNFGTDEGLPVSCFGLRVDNSINGIYSSLHEAAMLSKNGGGLGVDLSQVIGPTNVSVWARNFDQTASSVSQGGVRRGAVALYCRVDHPDIYSFLQLIDHLQGDVREKVDCNIGVIIPDSFMEKLFSGNEEAKLLASRIHELRYKYGTPYIMFLGNAQKADPPWYKDKGLSTKHSQLCAEIFLHSDEEHTYPCVLSSLNLSRWVEYKDWNYKGHSVTEFAIFFLDTVCEDFIERGSNINGLERAIRGAIKGRPLGLGVLGLHSLYQKLGYPWSSKEAFQLNKDIFSQIKPQAEKATQTLANQLGECYWCKGYGRRNTHLLAIAPTMTNSALCNAGSAGIEPIFSNTYSMNGAKGSFIRKNQNLEVVLETHNKNTPEVWASILEQNGSVQHLNFLSDREKDVFRRSFEIDQKDIIQQAIDRQPFICQGQSLNLFFDPDKDPQLVVDTFNQAYLGGIKALYYMRGKSKMQDVMRSNELGLVFLKTRNDCIWCKRAKKLLGDLNIPFVEEYKEVGRVPEIWVKGEKLPDGYTSLRSLLENKNPDSYTDSNLRETTCSSCDG